MPKKIYKQFRAKLKPTFKTKYVLVKDLYLDKKCPLEMGVKQ